MQVYTRSKHHRGAFMFDTFDINTCCVLLWANAMEAILHIIDFCHACVAVMCTPDYKGNVNALLMVSKSKMFREGHKNLFYYFRYNVSRIRWPGSAGAN